MAILPAVSTEAIRRVAIVLALAVAVTGCASGTGISGGAISSTAPTNHSKPAASPASTPAPSPVSSPAARLGPSATRTPGVLQGFGATRAEWNATHEQAPGFAQGQAFLPVVNGRQPKYAAVFGDDRITGYIIYMPKPTRMSNAKKVVLQEFPPGATFGRIDRDEPSCVTMEIISPAVQAALGMEYVPTVTFAGETLEVPLNESDIRSATMGVSKAGSESDLGSC